MTHAPGAASLIAQEDGALDRAAALVTSAQTDLQALTRRLDGQVQGLRSGWVGAGGTAFFALHQAWTSRQERVVAALSDLEAALRTTARESAATDQQHAHDLQRYAGLL